MASHPDFSGAQASPDDDAGALPQQLPPGSDGLQYIASNPDLIQVLGANEAAGEQHYAAFGEAEGRETDDFDEQGYLDAYPDLRAAFGTDTDAATRHYIQNGFREGRTAPPEGLPEGFDVLQYIASHDDLVPVFGTDLAAGGRHYLNFGQAEGRETDDFDEVQYLANYEDLQAAFGTDTDAATRHYIQNGFGEGRTDEPLGPGNTAPTAVADTGQATEDGDPVTIDVLANDTDPDEGDTLTVTAVSGLGEGEGTAAVSPDGASVIYTPPAELGELEEATFEYTVQDQAGGEDTATVTVALTAGGGPPTAADDTGEATEGGAAVTIDVLANDTDPDEGDTLTVTAVEGLDPAQGTVAVGEGGANVVYTPPAELGELEEATFEYTVQDEAGAEDTATVTVALTAAAENSPPAFTSPAAASVAENTLAALALAASDPEGAPVAFAIAGGADAGLFAVDAATNQLAFTAAPDFEAPADAGGDNVYEVVVTADDGAGGTATQAIAVTVTDAPDDEPPEEPPTPPGGQPPIETVFLETAFSADFLF